MTVNDFAAYLFMPVRKGLFTKIDLECMMRHKEGLYHRAKTQTSLGVHFDDEIRQKICTYNERTIDLLRKRTNVTNFSTNDMYCT